MLRASTASKLLCLGLVTALLGYGGTARADVTQGAIEGLVTDADNGQPVGGVTVVATDLKTGVETAEISSDTGRYDLPALAPGTYAVRAYYANRTVERPRVVVGAGQTLRINFRIQIREAAEQVVIVKDTVPSVNVGTSRISTRLNKDYIDNMPLGRDQGDLLATGVSTQRDQYGVSFGGSTSVENRVVLDGMDITEMGFARGSSRLLLPFLEESEIILGGYDAEFGRSMGGMVTGTVKSGGQRWSAGAFSTLQPLEAGRDNIHREGSPIQLRRELSYNYDLGADVGGPVVDKLLFFYGGFAYMRQRDLVTRITQTFLDADQDGTPDLKPDGNLQTQDLPGTELDIGLGSKRYQWVTKLDVVPAKNHRGALTFMGTTGRTNDLFTLGLGASEIAQSGTVNASRVNIDETFLDLGARWTSTFLDQALQLDAWVNWHGQRTEFLAVPGGNVEGMNFVGHPGAEYSLADFAGLGERVPAGCLDGTASDPYPNIVNCQINEPFLAGGYSGVLGPRDGDRINPKLTVTGRVEAAGFHQLKAGTDLSFDYFRTRRMNPGGSGYGYRITRDPVLDDMGNRTGFDHSILRFGFFRLGADASDMGGLQPRGLEADLHTRSLSFFLQDSWYPLPWITANLGLRIERQDLFWADQLEAYTMANPYAPAGTTQMIPLQDPVTGLRTSGKALDLPFLYAPRLGLVVDPSREGKSKIYGHYGWFFQQIPLGAAMRVFGGEQQKYDAISGAACGVEGANPTLPPPSCPFTGDQFSGAFGQGVTIVLPGTRPSHVEEIVFGAEYALDALVPDLTFGASYVRRTLEDGLEDFSVDNATTYIWGNPGRAPDESELRRLEELARAEEAKGTPEGTQRASDLRDRVALFKRSVEFEKPRREFNAVQLTFNKRFGNRWLAQGWYQYGRTEGNYPGLFSPDTGQLDPNLTSMYDLTSLLENRDGALPQDRPHAFRLDGSTVLPVGEVSSVVFGASVRGNSGIPINAAAAHNLYGGGESFLVPRGGAGRTPFVTAVDARVAYRHKLAKEASVEAFVDLFNLLNEQETLTVDNNYTFESVDPIRNAREADLRYAKTTDPYNPLGYGRVTKNNNYRRPLTRQTPTSVRFGLRGTF